jgi:hypothetical protein
MDATMTAAQRRQHGTFYLLGRLWREHVRHHRNRIILVLLSTAVMAGTTALYPVLIQHAFTMFEVRDPRILYQIPALVLIVTSVKAASQYVQNIEVQRIVLRVIHELQNRMSCRPTSPGWSARRRPSSPPASPPTRPSSARRSPARSTASPTPSQ